MESRLKYEKTYLPLKQDAIENPQKLLPTIPNLMLFKKQPNEQFIVLKERISME